MVREKVVGVAWMMTSVLCQLPIMMAACLFSGQLLFSVLSWFYYFVGRARAPRESISFFLAWSLPFPPAAVSKRGCVLGGDSNNKEAALVKKIEESCLTRSHCVFVAFGS